MEESDIRTKNQEREQRILDATETLIVRYGYDKTSVSDIARQAGISKGAVYLHFNSKDELLYRLMLLKMLKFVEQWEDRMKNETSSQVFSSMYRHVLTIMKESDFYWALFSKQRWLLGSSFTSHPNSAMYQQRFGLSQVLLTKLQAINAIRQDINTNATAYVFNMLNYGYAKLSDVIPEELAPPPDDVINEIAEMIQRHLQPEGDSNAREARKIILEFITGAKQLISQMLESKQQ